MIAWHSRDAEQTRAWGRRLGALLRRGDVLTLQGELGAGKTTLAQGLARGLGVTDRVASPTFVLAAEYAAPRTGVLRHLDCYRLPADEAARQAAELGLLDWLQAADGVLFIEWADRIPDLLPRTRLQIRLDYVPARPAERRLELRACGTFAAPRLQAMRRLAAA